MKRNIILPIVIVLIAILMTSCFASGNPYEGVADDFGTTAGFLRGIWHGFLCPFTFIVSLFTDGIHFYEVHNNGGWYNFGFVLGASIIFSGSGRASKMRRKS